MRIPVPGGDLVVNTGRGHAGVEFDPSTMQIMDAKRVMIVDA